MKAELIAHFFLTTPPYRTINPGMLCRPTNVAAANCQALLPLSSHFGEGTNIDPSSHSQTLKVFSSKWGRREPARNILKHRKFPVLAPLHCGTFNNLASCGGAILDISTLSPQYLSDIQIIGRNELAQV